jgi:hypothetical protein
MFSTSVARVIIWLVLIKYHCKDNNVYKSSVTLGRRFHGVQRNSERRGVRSYIENIAAASSQHRFGIA